MTAWTGQTALCIHDADMFHVDECFSRNSGMPLITQGLSDPVILAKIFDPFDRIF